VNNLDRLCMGCMNDKGDETICPVCGFNENSPQNPAYMPVRTMLDGRYLIGKVLDSNGDGVTYIAWDCEENVQVRIREYMPRNFCNRGDDKHSIVPVIGSETVFHDKMEQFLDLARALARLSDLPALFPVTDIFESNNTSYYVTESVRSITLHDFLLRNGGSLTWDQIRPLILPVINTLSELHAEGVVHGGISPDTLMVGRDGKIRISGFSISDVRSARTDMNSQLYSGFASIEQYGFDGKQGPWTDVYGIAATLFRVLVGNPPPEANERVTNDCMIIPAKIAQSMPKSVLTALAGGLAILPEDRTQSIDKFKSDLIGTQHAKSAKDPQKAKESRRYAIIAASLTVVLLAAIFYGAYRLVLKDKFFTSSEVESGVAAPSSQTVSLIPDPESKETYVQVPDFTGMSLAEIKNVADYNVNFEFEVSEKSYQDKYDRGDVYEQSPAAGEVVVRGAKVTVKVSLGSYTVNIPYGLKGQTYEKVYISLLELGFNPTSIHAEGKYDDSVAPGMVVEVEPASGTTVDVDSEVVIYINTYTGSSESSKSGSSSGSSSSGGSSTVR
jgi:serine/threonine protein kinase